MPPDVWRCHYRWGYKINMQAISFNGNRDQKKVLPLPLSKTC